MPIKQKKGIFKGVKGMPNITKNWYDVLPDEFKTPVITYPNFNWMNIELPAQIGIFGATGGGKTQWVLTFIECTAVFKKIVIYAKGLANDNLYLWLASELHKLGLATGTTPIEIYDNIDNVIPSSEYSINEPTLVVFDDFMNESEKKLTPVIDMFSKGRKNGVTVIWISQSYFKGTPIKIRQNMSYLVFSAMKNKRDIERIMSEKELDKSAKEIAEMYNYCMSEGPRSTFMIDSKTRNPKWRYRINYTPLLS